MNPEPSRKMTEQKMKHRQLTEPGRGQITAFLNVNCATFLVKSKCVPNELCKNWGINNCCTIPDSTKSSQSLLSLL